MMRPFRDGYPISTSHRSFGLEVLIHDETLYRWVPDLYQAQIVRPRGSYPNTAFVALLLLTYTCSIQWSKTFTEPRFTRFIHTRMYVCIHLYMYVRACMRACDTYMHKYVRVCVRTYMCAYVHTYIHLYIHNVHVYTCIHTFIIHTCMHTCIRTTHIPTYIHIRTRARVSTHTYVHVGGNNITDTLTY